MSMQGSITTLTTGSFAMVASYIKKPHMPSNPKISGTSTCAEVQANLTPPQVNAMTQAAELEMMMRLPLERIQSVAGIPGILRLCIPPVHAEELVAEATAWCSQFQEEEDEHRGKAGHGYVQVFAGPASAYVSKRWDGIDLQNSHRHCPLSARAPPMRGPRPPAKAHVL